MNFSAALCLAEYHNRKMATDLAMACVGVAMFFFFLIQSWHLDDPIMAENTNRKLLCCYAVMNVLNSTAGSVHICVYINVSNPDACFFSDVFFFT